MSGASWSARWWRRMSPIPRTSAAAPLASGGDELTPERLNHLRHVGVKAVTVFAGYTTIDLRDDEQPTTTRERARPGARVRCRRSGDRRSARRGGREVNEALTKKLFKAKVTKVEALLPAGRGESPLIKNTLAKDPTHSEAEALQQIYALLRPGEAPEPGDGPRGAEAAVLQPQALRSRPGGPLQDQPAAQDLARRRTTPC